MSESDYWFVLNSCTTTRPSLLRLRLSHDHLIMLIDDEKHPPNRKMPNVSHSTDEIKTIVSHSTEMGPRC